MGGQISGSGQHRVVPYDPAWNDRAEELIRILRRVLAGSAAAIEHIGSTSVPGLAARPIPDIQVSVRDINDRAGFYPQLVDAGYEHFRFPELSVDDYYVFVPSDGSNTEHIQVCEAGSRQEQRHLAVRDYLRAHPDERTAYEKVKRAAAESADGVRERYSAAKNDFVQSLEKRAVTWCRVRGAADEDSR
jgi:GrpB-like predicted nucleotidyltransferase (UPF0157 family)